MRQLKMAKLILLSLAAFAFASCSSDDHDEPEDKVKMVSVYYEFRASTELLERVNFDLYYLDEGGEQRYEHFSFPGTSGLYGSLEMKQIPATFGYYLKATMLDNYYAPMEEPEKWSYTMTMKPTIIYASGKREYLAPIESSFSVDCEQPDLAIFNYINDECRQTGLVQMVDKHGNKKQTRDYVW